MTDRFIEIATEYIYGNKLKNENSESVLRKNIESLGLESSLVDELILKINNQFILEEAITFEIKKIKKTVLPVFIFSLLVLMFSFYNRGFILLNIAGFSAYFINKSKYDKLIKEREYRKTKMRWWIEE